MARIRRKVTVAAAGEPRSLEWMSSYVLLMERLRHNVAQDTAPPLLRLDRGSGYTGIDVLMFLVAYFASGQGCGIKVFSEKTEPYGRKVAAAAGRKNWPTQASISRALGSVSEEAAADVARLLLLHDSACPELESHESVVYRDTEGGIWHVFHHDAKVKALRHRALPERDDLPPAKRRSAEMAAPGHAGRKRGNVQITRGTLQHAGTGLWLGITLASGNGSPREELLQSTRTVEDWAEDRGMVPGNCVICTDGAGRGYNQIRVGTGSPIRFLTRYAEPDLLNLSDMRDDLAGKAWRKVSDSGSGPVRYAREMGELVLAEGRRMRVAISRFHPARGRKSGAGTMIDGWQYETFATDLPVEAWPAAELVTLYYSRCGQENRFAAENREIGLDRIFSYHRPAQLLVNAVGLWVWNQRIICGSVAAGGPGSFWYEPEPRPESGRILPGPGETIAEADGTTGTAENATAEDAVGAAAEEAGGTGGMDGATDEGPAARGADDRPSATGPPTIAEAVVALRREWQGRFDADAGWRWSTDYELLVCPQGEFQRPHDIRKNNGSHVLRLRCTYGACSGCTDRCSASDALRFRKECTFPLPAELPPPEPDQARPVWWGATGVGALPRFPPDPELRSGPHAMRHVALLPAELRKEFDRICDLTATTVRIAMSPPRPRPSKFIAESPDRRRKRRRSWSERLDWNALPEGTVVNIASTGPMGFLRLQGGLAEEEAA